MLFFLFFLLFKFLKLHRRDQHDVLVRWVVDKPEYNLTSRTANEPFSMSMIRRMMSCGKVASESISSSDSMIEKRMIKVSNIELNYFCIFERENEVAGEISRIHQQSKSKTTFNNKLDLFFREQINGRENISKDAQLRLDATQRYDL